MTDPANTPREELNVIDGLLLQMLGDRHRHLCVSCIGAEGGCINCRHTGYDQSPCLICDKDGIAFKNRREFLDKVKAEASRREQEAFNQGWTKGWNQRHVEEDYSEIIGRLKAMKPQKGAFFLIGEIESAATDAKRQALTYPHESPK